MARIDGREWDEMVKFFDNRCVKCNKKTPIGMRITKDHIRPRSRGGLDVIENIQPLCYACNLNKGNRSYKDYRPLAAKMLGKELPEKYGCVPLPNFDEWRKQMGLTNPEK